MDYENEEYDIKKIEDNMYFENILYKLVIYLRNMNKRKSKKEILKRLKK
jgi:hypothetical protein